MHIALNDISYAASARTRPARALIRTVENATGRLALLARARKQLQDHQASDGFWRSMIWAYGLQLNLLRGNLDEVPAKGPLVVVANHPFGILDGLVMGYLLDGLRRDFRIMAHSAFMAAPDVGRHILPIYFAGTDAARRANLRSRAEAISYLKGGGRSASFPAARCRPRNAPSRALWTRNGGCLPQK